MQNVCILGATGSIGKSTLKILEQYPTDYQLYAVTAHSQIVELAKICEQFKPKIAVVPLHKVDELAKLLAQKNQLDIEILSDEQGLIQVAQDSNVHIVMAAIVGAAGLLPTLSAIKAGKKVLLANKEALVMSGEMMMQAVKQHNALLLPVDSEHNAIFQSLPPHYMQKQQINIDGQPMMGVSQILLTASGGPFLNFDAEELKSVTPEQACKHPNWSMGRKISVDSASLMNKGLELIEACHLFNLTEQFITIVIHPESIIHSMVQYVDGSTIAQMSNPDMCTPIAYALAYPNRISTHVPALDLFQHSQLNFEQPDTQRFPALNLARQAMRLKGTAPCILNAANEIAVSAFLNQKILFTDIPQVIDFTLNQMEFEQAIDLEMIIHSDQQARAIAEAYIQREIL